MPRKIFSTGYEALSWCINFPSALVALNHGPATASIANSNSSAVRIINSSRFACDLLPWCLVERSSYLDAHYCIVTIGSPCALIETLRALGGIWTRDLCLTKATLYQAELPRHQDCKRLIPMIVPSKVPGRDEHISRINRGFI